MKKFLTLALLAVTMAMAQMTGQSTQSSAAQNELTIGSFQALKTATHPGGVVSDIVLTSNVVKNFADKDAAMKDADVPLPPLLASITANNKCQTGKGVNVKEFKKESARPCNNFNYS